MPTALEIAALNSDAVNPDRAKTSNLQATFFRGEEDGLDYCRIINMHDQGKNDLIQRVNSSHVGRWPKLWAAYQNGRAQDAPTGTSLRLVPGVDEATALVFQLRGVANAEALSKLDDLSLDAIVGEGGKALRSAARLVLRAKDADRLEMELLEERTKPKAESPAQGISPLAAQATVAAAQTDAKQGQGQGQSARR